MTIRTSLLVALALGSATLATAQIELRPHIGANIQHLTESPDGTEWTGNPGLQIGMHLMIGSQFFVQPGIQYVSSKSDLVVVGTSNSDYTLTTNSLRVPVVIGYRFSDPASEPLLNVRLFGGLAANFPLSASFNEDGLEDVDLGPANLAITAGAGLDISIFFIEAGYDVGVSNVFDDEDFEVDAKQNQFQVNAGVRLKFAK